MSTKIAKAKTARSVRTRELIAVTKAKAKCGSPAAALLCVFPRPGMWS